MLGARLLLSVYGICIAIIENHKVIGRKRVSVTAAMVTVNTYSAVGAGLAKFERDKDLILDF